MYTLFFVYDKSIKQATGIAGIKEMSQGIFTVTDIAVSPDFQGKGNGKQIVITLVNSAFNQHNANVGTEKSVPTFCSKNYFTEITL